MDKQDIESMMSAFSEKILESINTGNKNVLETLERIENSQKENTAEIERNKRNVRYLDREIRRNKLLIYGISENKPETYKQLERVVIKTIRDYLDIEITEYDIDLLKRNGPINKENRPISLNLTRNKIKIDILKKRGMFRGSKIYVNEEYSKEVYKTRKVLTEKMWEARNSGKYAIIKYDKLIVEDRKNNQHSPRSGKRTYDDTISPVKGNYNSKYRGHCDKNYVDENVAKRFASLESYWGNENRENMPNMENTGKELTEESSIEMNRSEIEKNDDTIVSNAPRLDLSNSHSEPNGETNNATNAKTNIIPIKQTSAVNLFGYGFSSRQIKGNEIEGEKCSNGNIANNSVYQSP